MGMAGQVIADRSTFELQPSHSMPHAVHIALNLLPLLRTPIQISLISDHNT